MLKRIIKKAFMLTTLCICGCGGGGGGSTEYIQTPSAPAPASIYALQGKAETGARETERSKKKKAINSDDTRITGSQLLSTANAGQAKTLLGQ